MCRAHNALQILTNLTLIKKTNKQTKNLVTCFTRLRDVTSHPEMTKLTHGGEGLRCHPGAPSCKADPVTCALFAFIHPLGHLRVPLSRFLSRNPRPPGAVPLEARLSLPETPLTASIRCQRVTESPWERPAQLDVQVTEAPTTSDRDHARAPQGLPVSPQSSKRRFVTVSP